MFITDIKRVIDQVSREKGIEPEVLINTLKEAIISAARKKIGPRADIEVHYDSKTGDVEVFHFKEVVEEVVEPEPVMMTKTHKEEYGTGTFEFDSAKLTDSVSERLDNFVNFLNEYPQAQVEITGYTDSSGPAAYNLKLSERRAQAVADYLIAAGIDADRFTVTGMGEENPVADNSTHEGREKNRRVEVVVPEFQYEELVQPE